MRWGLGLYTGQVPPGQDIGFRDEYARIVEQAQLAEELGLDSVWLSEHHGADDGYLPSLLPLAAAILASTERLVVGTAVLLAPLHHPLRLAEDAAVVDQLSGGRLVLGLGTGWRSGDFRSFGVDMATRAVALEETVQILRRAWQGERFDFEGRVHRIEGGMVRPRPFRPGGPPIWLGGTGPRALRRAGRLGDGYFGVGAPFDDAMGAFAAARDAVPEDRQVPFSFGQLRSGFIAEDPQRAWERAGRGMTYTLDVHARWAAEEAGRAAAPGEHLVSEETVRQYNLLGTPADATNALLPYAERFARRPDCHLAFRLYHPYMPHEQVLAAIQAYGRTVVPALRKAAG
ncbi:LLM class flavin-dependent oxidoreductase [Streptomyces sp. NPDC047009]|uniref:LLM class flavin-dependent oxidoreductase n=1 Tax=Streptomyces sp. NPDC047009 TaxID=3154496 RepID=UPI0033EFAEBB